jgi:carboxypeptidase family protein/TonB-dependent receptor-like protein
MRPRSLLIFSISTLILFSSISESHNAFAQSTAAMISGVVRDETGAVIAGATVTAKAVETGIARTMVTDGEGRYRIPQLDLGNYEVQASLTGFQSEVRAGIILTIGVEAAVNFTLKIGAVTQAMIVTGEAPLVDTARSGVGGLVAKESIENLPLNGRSFTDLATLEPGVVSDKTAQRQVFGGRGLKLSIAGARPEQNSFLLDGTDINDMYGKAPGSAAGVLLGVDTVQEFKTLTHNFTAEYGRAAGGIITVATKSGTNQIRGTAFEFLRNSALDAKNFFDNPNDSIPAFKRNQFGGTLGAPIRKDRTFFFGGYEELLNRLGTSIVANVPDALARQGFLPDPRTGQLRYIGVYPGTVPYLQLFPLPNGPNFGNGVGQFLGSNAQPTTERYFSFRMDHNISSSDSIFIRYTFDNANITSPDPLNFFQLIESTRNQYVTVEEKKILSPTLLNTIRLGFNRSTQVQDQDLIKDVPAALNLEPGKPFGKRGIIVVGGLAALGASDIRHNFYNLFEISDDIYFNRGNYTLKFGAIAKRIQLNTVSTQFDGRYTFTNLETFLGGQPNLFQTTLPGTDAVRGLRQSLFGFYVQNEYRVGPRLTVNLGLRYEFITIPREVNGKEANLCNPRDVQPRVGPGVLFCGQNPSVRNFAPRIGLSWDPTGTAKTVIRSGFGLFYDQILSYQYFTLASRVDPFYFQASLPNPPFPDVAKFLSQAVPQLRTWAGDFHSTPYTMQWNLEAEREVLPSTLVRIGYSGSKGTNLFRLFNAETADPVILPGGTRFFPADAKRINSRYSQIRTITTDGNSIYNGLLLAVIKRFPGGQVQVSYTFGRTIDNGSQVYSQDFVGTDAYTMDRTDVGRDRAVSAMDVRHNLVLSYQYGLPLKWSRTRGAAKLLAEWQVGGILSLQTGNPANVEINFSRSRNQAVANFAERPDLSPGKSNNPVLGGPDRYFDPTAFSLQPAGFYGNLGRNSVIGPGLATFDFSLIKNNPVREKMNVQFRAEFFNVLNRPNFSSPNAIVFLNTSGVPSGDAGRISGTTTASRQIQFGLRIYF